MSALKRWLELPRYKRDELRSLIEGGIDTNLFDEERGDHYCDECDVTIHCDLARSVGGLGLFDKISARLLLDLIDEIEEGAAPPPPAANDETPDVTLEHVARERDEWRARALDLEAKIAKLTDCVRVADGANKKALEEVKQTKAEIERTKELLRRLVKNERERATLLSQIGAV
jgi:hypothetical protein